MGRNNTTQTANPIQLWFIFIYLLVAVRKPFSKLYCVDFSISPDLNCLSSGWELWGFLLCFPILAKSNLLHCEHEPSMMQFSHQKHGGDYYRTWAALLQCLARGQEETSKLMHYAPASPNRNSHFKLFILPGFFALKNVKILLFFPQEGIFVSQFTAAFVFVSSNFPTSWWNFDTIFCCGWDTLQQARKAGNQSICHQMSSLYIQNLHGSKA